MGEVPAFPYYLGNDHAVRFVRPLGHYSILHLVWTMKINKDTLLTWGVFASFTDDKHAQENGYHGNADQYELVLPTEIQEKIYDLISEHLEKAEAIELPSDLPYIFE